MPENDEEEILVEDDGMPAIFLRQVDVIIQNGDEEPIIIKANQEGEEKNEQE